MNLYIAYRLAIKGLQHSYDKANIYIYICMYIYIYCLSPGGTWILTGKIHNNKKKVTDMERRISPGCSLHHIWQGFLKRFGFRVSGVGRKT